MKLLTTTAILTVLAAPLWAEATDEGAAAIKSAFETYLGATEGVVTVAVEGETYAVTLDAMPLLASVSAEGATTSASPLVLTVTDNGDGTYGYAADQAFSMELSMGAAGGLSYVIDTLVMTGTFDAAVMDTTESHMELMGLTSTQTQPMDPVDPASGLMTVTSRAESQVWDTTSAAGASGRDATFTATSGPVTYEMAIPDGPDMPAMSVSASIASSTSEGTVTGYRPDALYALLAFFVSHPDESTIMADQAGLKALLETGMPFFENMTASGTAGAVEVTTPIGPFALSEATFELELNGLVPEGFFREAVAVKGLTLPEGLVPPFAAALVPQEVSFDLSAEGYDAAAAALLGMGLLDASAPPPEDFDAQMLAALLPEGIVDITLSPGGVIAPAYGLTYEGQMQVGPNMPLPTGAAKITLAGIEDVLSALDAAPEDMKAQALPMIGMAQAMAQPGPSGELVWEIDATTPGSLLVNGMDMMGGQ